MKTFATLALATSLLLGCQNESKLGNSGFGDIETRVKKLEDQNKKYAEALDFLQKVYDQQKGQQEAQEREEPADDAVFAIDIAPNVAGGQVDGPNTACVTVVEAWDFACPFCQRVSSTLTQLVKDFSGKVRVVYKNMVVHPQVVMKAHQAGCAASKQGKFLQFKDTWWEKAYRPYAAARDASKLGEENIVAIAKDLKLDMAKFKADMDGAECKARVDGDMNELAKWHVNSTPSFFINGRPFRWGGDPNGFKQEVDQQLKNIQTSGVPCADYYDKEVIAKGEKQFRSKKDPKPH